MQTLARSAYDDNAVPEETARSLQDVLAYVNESIEPIHPKLLLASMLSALIPKPAFPRIRCSILRAIGFEIGIHSGFLDMPDFFAGPGDIYKRFKVGKFSYFNIGCKIDLNGHITIGDRVNVGPDVMIITGTHEIGPESQRAAEMIMRPVIIEDGVWIGARSVILAGVTIGRGAVISGGTVVRRDVPPNTILIDHQGMPIEKWRIMTRQSSSMQTTEQRSINMRDS